MITAFTRKIDSTKSRRSSKSSAFASHLSSILNKKSKLNDLGPNPATCWKNPLPKDHDVFKFSWLDKLHPLVIKRIGFCQIFKHLLYIKTYSGIKDWRILAVQDLSATVMANFHHSISK